MTTRFTPGTWLEGGRGSWLIADENGVPQPAQHYAMKCRLEGREIPVRPDEANGFKLFTERQIALLKLMDEGKLNGKMTLRGILKALARIMR